MEEKQQKVLEELGLSMNEAKIYRALLKMKDSSVPNIALETGVNKRNVYDTMPKLEQRGLVFQISGSREVRYGAVDPKNLKDLLAEKEQRLQDVLPSLTKTFSNGLDEHATFVYKGTEGLKNYLRDMVESGEDVYSIGAKGAWFVPGNEEFIETFLKDAKKRKIEFNHLFDHEIKELEHDFPSLMGEKYKFLPKDYSTTGAIDIYADKVVTFSGLSVKRLSEDVSFTVIQNRELADCYRTWFRFMWDRLD